MYGFHPMNIPVQSLTHATTKTNNAGPKTEWNSVGFTALHHYIRSTTVLMTTTVFPLSRVRAVTFSLGGKIPMPQLVGVVCVVVEKCFPSSQKGAAVDVDDEG